MSMSNIFSEEPVSQLNFNPVDPESNGTVKLCSSHQNRIIEICQLSYAKSTQYLRVNINVLTPTYNIIQATHKAILN